AHRVEGKVHMAQFSMEIMRLTGSVPRGNQHARPFVPATTNSRHGWQVVPNLARGMILNGVNQLWVADITFLHLAEEFAFLAVVLDAFSRRVVGWALDTHLKASLAIEALEMAITDRQPVPGSLVHHSDRGVQGRFNRSPQHPKLGGVNGYRKAEIGAVNAREIILARSTTCMAA
ncbi:DDE-type integrase/transposase/recombinase, partial [Ensifer sp. OV372]|uniref:DDE-type integrase/transposase/recombinase n=1 Tax=Ensifer sp. OV372 TaxID=1855293 RepID=UPI001AECB103